MKAYRSLIRIEDTQQLATELAANPDWLTGQVIYLQGDLGMGKTTLAQFLLAALGYAGRVKSPTYGLLEQYEVGPLQVLHLDLYRLEDPEELEYLGLRDLHDQHSLLLVEWPSKGEGALPLADLEIRLDGGAAERFAEIELLNPSSELAQLGLFCD